MDNFEIRRFEEADAEAVSEIVRRNFLEVNSLDYGLAEMEKKAKDYGPERVLRVAGFANTYVATMEKKVAACGAISSFWDSLDESILLMIFVLPELHGKGIGKAIIQALEEDELFLRAKRIEIPASITACEFYRRLGYDYKNGIKELDEEGHYRMEKVRAP